MLSNQEAYNRLLVRVQDSGRALHMVVEKVQRTYVQVEWMASVLQYARGVVVLALSRGLVCIGWRSSCCLLHILQGRNRS